MNVATATSMLTTLPRVLPRDVEAIASPLSTSTLMLGTDVAIEYLADDTVRTTGLDKLDDRRRELVSLVVSDDPDSADYLDLNILAPRTYVDSQRVGLHVVAQALCLMRWSDDVARAVSYLERRYDYGRHAADALWIGSTVAASLSRGDVTIVMNRRVGGWDGSVERPVIELLGAGGHVQTIWEPATRAFRMRSIVETLALEFVEELGLPMPSDYQALGGFINTETSELVVLVGVFLTPNQLIDAQKHAHNNVDENIDGVYVGEMRAVLDAYDRDPSYFAGGSAAKATNFPSQPAIMKRLLALAGT